jgi:hypothetical protein
MPSQPDHKPSIVPRVCGPEWLGVGHQNLQILFDSRHVEGLHGFDVGLEFEQQRQGVGQAWRGMKRGAGPGPWITITIVLQYLDANTPHPEVGTNKYQKQNS